MLVLYWYHSGLTGCCTTAAMHAAAPASILPRKPPPAVRWLVGVDGGGTHTRVRLTDALGRRTGQGQAGPSALGQGVAQAWRHVGQALAMAAQAAGTPPPDWHDCAVGAGLSGAQLPRQAADFLGADPGCAALVLDTDGFAGLLGAHGGQPGLLLVGGTGSVCEALGPDGHRRSAGGWGWRLGDEGSGAWIGQQALRHAQRALDGRAAAGPLARAVLQAVGPAAADVLAWAAEADQRAFATLAPMVFDLAPDDPVAAALLDHAAAELDTLVRATDPDGGLPLAVAGSVALRLLDRWPAAVRARVVAARADATEGALLLLRRHLAAQAPQVPAPSATPAADPLPTPGRPAPAEPRRALP